MKTKIIAVSGILIAMNLLIGLLLSAYSGFNLLFSTVVLLVSAALVYLVHSIRVSDAIKVSFTLLFTLSGLIKYILSLVSPDHLVDNWGVIACIVITAFEVMLLVVYRKRQL